MLLILQVSCRQNCEVRYPRASQDAVASIEAEGDAFTADRYCGLRGRIKKPTYERATIYEQLRELPPPTPLESTDCRSYTDPVISHGH